MSDSIFDKNYYELFNVSEDASDIEIKKAYARLVRQYTNETHPEEFMHIRKAYQVLTNPSEREQYNRMLNQQYTNTFDQGQTYDTNQSYESDQYYDNYSYNDTYSDYQSQNDQQSYYNDYHDENYDTYNQYDSTNYDTYNTNQYDTYQTDYQQTSQPNYYDSTTYTETKPRSQYSLIGNIIFSIIISLIFTPIVGIITGIVIHVFKIPIMKVVGCIFWIVVALIVLGFLMEFI